VAGCVRRNALACLVVVFLLGFSHAAFDPSSVGFADTFSRKGRRDGVCAPFT
jgi:hypothetical protein